MLKFSHQNLISIAGCIWLIIGCFLLNLGLRFLVEPTLIDNLQSERSYPLLTAITPLFGSIGLSVIVLILVSLMVGYFKGKFVLGKSVHKAVNRIKSLPNPASLGYIYEVKYYILLGSMILLGLLAKLLPFDARGVVDVTIGAALINGSIIYFREANRIRNQKKMIKVEQE